MPGHLRAGQSTDILWAQWPNSFPNPEKSAYRKLAFPARSAFTAPFGVGEVGSSCSLPATAVAGVSAISTNSILTQYPGARCTRTSQFSVISAFLRRVSFGFFDLPIRLRRLPARLFNRSACSGVSSSNVTSLSNFGMQTHQLSITPPFVSLSREDHKSSVGR